MDRMGHGSVRAALIYQHATDRDRAIAVALDALASQARRVPGTDREDDDGTDRTGT